MSPFLVQIHEFITSAVLLWTLPTHFLHSTCQKLVHRNLCQHKTMFGPVWQTGAVKRSLLLATHLLLIALLDQSSRTQRSWCHGQVLLPSNCRYRDAMSAVALSLPNLKKRCLSLYGIFETFIHPKNVSAPPPSLEAHSHYRKVYSMYVWFWSSVSGNRLRENYVWHYAGALNVST